MKKLLNLESLTRLESFELFTKFAKYPQEKQAAILALLRAKKESTEEILGAIQHFSQYSTTIKHDFDPVDIVGTGGDGLGSFNISMAASLVVASCGVLVAKHGGRSATSTSGSQDVVDALGIQVPNTAEGVLQYLHETNYAYLCAPLFNTELKQYALLRKKLSFPTIFNVIGPLLNPMRAKRCVIGVYRKDLMQKVTEILVAQGVRRALVVCSEDGLDEISVSDRTHVVEIKNTHVKSYVLDPKDLGFALSGLSDVRGGSAKDNAKIIQGIFSGEVTGPKLDIVLFNSAAGLYVAGKVENIAAGLKLAQQSIHQGKAMALLNKMRGSI